jgi:outer membrane protein TolC
MKKVVLSMVLPLFLQAQSIPELFDALKSHAQSKSDMMMVKKSEIQKSMVNASLYPTVDLFASYDNYSTPTGMVPIPPNDLTGMVQDQSIPQAFSYNIYKAGAKFSMPIYVKSIYTTAKKAKAMQESAKAKKRINLLKNEAVIVASNANFIYLVSLKKSLEGKEKSLNETKKTLEIKVNNGRSPASALYKLNDSLNELAISKNNIELEKKKIISKIESLTGISLDKPAKMQLTSTYEKGLLGSLKPVEKKIEANRIDVKAQKEKLYPALFAHGSYVYSSGKAYNNDKDVNEEYGNVGLTLNIPLLEVSQYRSVALARVELQSSELELEKMRDELVSEAKMYENSLPLLENSILLHKHSIKDKKELLKIAKVNFNSGRLSTEEYLRYEDAVVTQEANLYKVEATKWQTVMQLAVIYANDIEEMVQ